MRRTRITLLILIILLSSLFAAGCWNYREVDKLAIVAGVAVDKGSNGQYKLTVEIIQISGERDTKATSKMITMEGKTMFDAARNIISLSGKRLYWSHTKVIILSKEIAGEGITKVIDWYNRDSETREDANILISEGDSAKEIFDGQEISKDIKSFALEEMIKNQKALNKAPIIDILKFNIQSQTKGMSTIIPTVKLRQVEGKMLPQIMGAAIIKEDKLVGFLNGEETTDLNFIKNEVKGGLLIEEMQTNDIPTLVSLEIFKSKTHVTPVEDGKEILINLNIRTTVSIDEIAGTENYILDDEGRQKLEQNAEKKLKERIEALISKMQSEYGVDIFGFGAKLREDKTEVWNRVSRNWEDEFRNLNVKVTTKIDIRNSAMVAKPLETKE